MAEQHPPGRNASRDDWAEFLGQPGTDKSRDELIAEYDLSQAQAQAADDIAALNEELDSDDLEQAASDFGVLAGDGPDPDNESNKGFSVLA